MRILSVRNIFYVFLILFLCFASVTDGRQSDNAPPSPEDVVIDENKSLISWKSSQVNPYCTTGTHLKIFENKDCIIDIILPANVNRYEIPTNRTLHFSSVSINLQALGQNDLTSDTVIKAVPGKSGIISNKNSVENVRHTWTESDNLEVSWDSPPPPCDVEYYSIVVWQASVKVHSVETNSKNYTFQGLEACTSYKLIFNAYDQDKRTKYKTVEKFPPMLMKDPGQPTNFLINSTTFVASWGPASKYPFCVHGYHLKLFLHKVCIKDIVLPKDVREYQLSDINSCSQYVATIAATGSPNWSSTSTSKDVIMKFDEHYNMDKVYIEDLSHETLSSGVVRLKWRVPEMHKCVNDYVVSFYNARGLQMLVTNVSVVNIPDLDPCVPHRITVVPRTAFKEFIGKSNEVVVRTKALVSGPVRNLYGTTAASGKALLYWMPPTEYPACVEEYSIQQMIDNSPDKMSYTKDLYLYVPAKTCVHYLFVVSAMNMEGAESIGQELAYFHLPEDGLIDKVSFQENITGLLVSWKTSAFDYACFKLFKVDLCALDNEESCRSLEPQSRIGRDKFCLLIPNIASCSTYKISISASDTDRRYGFFSEIYRSEAKVFKQPEYISITNLNARSVRILWRVPDFDHNRCEPLNAEIDCVTSQNEKIFSFLNVTKTTEIVSAVNNLMPFTNYSCTLSVSNVAGLSDKSAEVTFQTHEDVPSMPKNMSVVKVSHDSVKLSWKPPEFANGILKGYRVDFTHSRLRYNLPSWCYYANEMNRSIFLPAKILEYETQRLNSFTEYTVTVYASSNAGFSIASKAVVSTSPTASGIVTQPQYVNVAPLSYTVTWKQPCRSNGILKSFKVTVVGQRKGHKDDVFSCLVSANLSFPEHLYSVKLPTLRPVYNYRVGILAFVMDVDADGKESFFEFSTPASMPPIPELESLHRKVNPQGYAGVNGTAVKITLTKDMFDDNNGEILYYAIIVGRDILQNNRMESGIRKTATEWPLMNTWAEASEYGFIPSYQVTPPFWNPFGDEKDNNSKVFVIGNDLECSTPSQLHCNGPLKPDTAYSLRIRAFTAVGYQDSPPIKFSTGSETFSAARSNYLLVVCVLVLLAFVVCGLYYIRNGHVPLIVEVRQRMSGKQQLTVVQANNISIKKFAKYHSRLQNSPQILRIEFNELNEISNKLNLSDNIGKRYDNYRKNRYLNIIPYDETRVKIQTERGDYINASFIEGFKNVKNRYIACQGPLPETFSDFWNMVLQYDVAVIIMLCQILENKRVVCEKYFPDVNQTLKFDGINVECTLFTSTSLYEERKIVVTKDTKEAIVSHIKFLEWPDFHVPSGPEILVDFCYAVRERFTNSPVIVHCSAGVGRTGTFIACDILLRHIPNNDVVNIFNTVLKLRKQRPHMVQSVAQYIYLYDCVFYAVSKYNSKR